MICSTHMSNDFALNMYIYIYIEREREREREREIININKLFFYQKRFLKACNVG